MSKYVVKIPDEMDSILTVTARKAGKTVQQIIDEKVTSNILSQVETWVVEYLADEPVGV